jgi:hypothetical protein
MRRQVAARAIPLVQRSYTASLRAYERWNSLTPRSGSATPRPRVAEFTTSTPAPATAALTHTPNRTTLLEPPT